MTARQCGVEYYSDHLVDKLEFICSWQICDRDVDANVVREKLPEVGSTQTDHMRRFHVDIATIEDAEACQSPEPANKSRC